MSPVWMMKSGCLGKALILVMVSLSVSSGLGLAGLLKPIWLSDLDERQPSRIPGGAVRTDQRRGSTAAAHGPDHAAAGPGHALEHFAAGQAALRVFRVLLVHIGLLGSGMDPFAYRRPRQNIPVR